MKERYIVSDFPVSFALLAVTATLAKTTETPLLVLGNILYDCQTSGCLSVEPVVLKDIQDDLHYQGDGTRDYSTIVQIKPGLDALNAFIRELQARHIHLNYGWTLSGITLSDPAVITLLYLQK